MVWFRFLLLLCGGVKSCLQLAMMPIFFISFLDISASGNFHALYQTTAYASEDIQLISQTYFTSLLLTLFQHLVLWCYKNTWQWWGHWELHRSCASHWDCTHAFLTCSPDHHWYGEGWSQPCPGPKDLIEWWWWVEGGLHTKSCVCSGRCLCNSSFPEWMYLVSYLKNFF